MAGNAGLSSKSYIVWVRIVLGAFSYYIVYDFLKYFMVPIALFFLYSATFISFREVERKPLRQLVELEKEDDTKPDVVDPNVEALFTRYPVVSKQMDELLDLLIHDFVESWFQNIDPCDSSAFPRVVKNTVLQAIAKLKNYISETDETEFVLLKILPLLTRHFKTFCAAREAVLKDASFDRHKSNMNLQIAVEFNKSYKLHRALSLRASCQDEEVENHVRSKVQKLLPYLISRNELKSPLIAILLREVVSACVITPLILKYVEPDNWNLTLISISEKKLQEHDQVLEIRRILSKEVEFQGLNSVKDSETNDLIDAQLHLTPECSEKQFEDYLRQISLLETLESLKATRLVLLSKLMLLNEDDHLIKPIQEYKKRLLLSLNLIQTRLSYLDSKNYYEKTSGRNTSKVHRSSPDHVLQEFNASLSVISFDDILAEQVCLEYFRRYLHSQQLKNEICYLKFYELVEEMKNPLEDSCVGDITVTFPFSEICRLKDMIVSYGSLHNLKLLDPGLVKNISLFVSNFHTNDDQAVVLARRSMFLLQNEAKRALCLDIFDDFKKSKYFFLMISDSEFMGTGPYSKILNLPDENSISAVGKRINSSRVFSSPHIDDALDSMLRISKGSRKQSNDNLPKNMASFEAENLNEALLGDSIFTDDVVMEREKATIRGRPEAKSRSDASSSNEIASFNDESHTTFASLKEEIANLTIVIDQIEKQLGLLSHLILKAELTNNRSQLKLLKKSEIALVKDLENKELLKQQYMVQENANSLFKKTKISIKSYYVDQQIRPHREVTYYLLNVSHINNGQVTSWEVPRRFSEFYRLNAELKKKYKHLIQHLQKKDMFPEKVKMALKYHVSKSLLYDERKVQLERYLRELLSIPEICQDDMFRQFVANLTGFNNGGNVKGEQKDGEDLERSIPSLNYTAELGVKGAMEFQTRKIDSNCDEDSDFYDDEFNFYTNTESIIYQEKSFIKAICDFFVSIFALNESNSGWLRGRAIITVLQQLLGSAIEKYIKDNSKRLRSENQITDILASVKAALYSPQNVRRSKTILKEPRTVGEMARTKLDCRIMLQSLFSEVCGKVVGLRNAQNSAINIHAMLQNPYLNASILLETLDLTFDEIFCHDTTPARTRQNEAPA